MFVSRIRLVLTVLLMLAAALFAAFAYQRSRPSDSDPQRMSAHWFDDHQQGRSKRAARAGVPVTPKEDQERTHEHVALRVIGPRGQYCPPSGFGLTDRGQELAIHAHDNTCTVHLHYGRGQRAFTLGQLLTVWGIPEREWPAARGWVNQRPIARWSEHRLSDRQDIVLSWSSEKPRLPDFDWKLVPLDSQ